MLHTIKREHPNKTQKRVGRGQSSGKGKTAGRGTKGQKARGNTKIRPMMRDIIKKIPKRRGYGKNRSRGTYVKAEFAIINVSSLVGMTLVNPQTLVTADLISPRLAKNGVKILGSGNISNAVTVSNCDVSESARTKIVAAGGTVA
ncbi:MAG TPA: 50S ribosomal protein L15 [Candidatus Paceibacterota bacterium]|nr:50S ribosomal protein L15 [Candidatus Paceibacterota bacterium]